ncbi:MAG: hypothetical protein KF813_03610 [Trueperaceae bacterium]|nr:hypothetical protein [Trueperaceae bacterium]
MPRSAPLCLVIFLLLLVALTGCGTGPIPPDGGLQDVPGQVTLPAGAGLNLATLTVVGAHGTFPVAADGKFTARVPVGVVAEMAVVGADDEVLLLALREGAAVVANATTTAQGLLFYLLGGYMLPSDQHDKLRTLIGEEAALTTLAAELEGVLAGGGRPLTDGSASVEAALQDAWDAVLGDLLLDDSVLGGSLLGDSALGDAGDPSETMRALLPQQVGGSNNIVLEPGAGVLQAGSAVIHNPQGAGVAVQNHFRRPAALLAYQVGYEDASGNTFDISPPVLTRTIDVPSTGRLDVFEALQDVITGDAPWTPALSGGLPLALHGGTHKTFYELVLLGPSLDVVTRPPIYDDARFSGQRSAWNGIIADKVVEQFLDDIALPLLESLMFGGAAKFDAAELRSFRSSFRAATDTHLASLGIYLKEGGNYATAVKRFLENIAQNSFYRNELFEGMRNALPEARRNQLHFESMSASLSSRASSSAIAAAVQISLAVGDLAAMLKDLNDALPAVSWSATAAPTLFYLSPEGAYFTKSQPQVELTVGTKGPVTGSFLSRWSTTGPYGRLTDGPNSGLNLITPHNNVWYTHNTPLNITDEQQDSVTVEVFQVDPGATTIPAGAESLARMTSLLEGFNREIDSRLELHSGFTPQGFFRNGISVACSSLYLRIPKVAGTRFYDVQFSNWGGVGHEYNYNSNLSLTGSRHIRIDVTDPYGWTLPFEGVCVWRSKTGEWTGMPLGLTVYDDGNSYLVNVNSTFDFLPGATIPDGHIGIGGQIRLWYDWASQGTVTVTGVR